MKNIDPQSARVLEFAELKELLKTYAGNDLGREKIERIHPLQDRKTIQTSLDQTSEVCRLLQEGHQIPLASLQDFRPAVERAVSQGTVLSPGELLDVAQSLHVAGSNRRFLHNLHPHEFPRLKDFSSKLKNLDFILEPIEDAISSQEEIDDHASPKLRKIRRKIKEKEQKIDSICQKLLRNNKIRKALQDQRPTLRGDRLCLAVKAGHRHKVRGLILDSSQSGQTLFIEPEQLVPLGNKLAELKYDERNEINRILRKLTQLVVKNREKLFFTLDALSWLDFTHAKSQFSEDYNMSCPQLVDDGRLDLRHARHPLLLAMAKEELPPDEKEKMFDQVVPFSLTLGDEFDILIITGPNTGGKTVTMKAVGLMVFMTQCGMHIPAGAHSSLPIYDKVYASVGDEQSLQNSLSTFSANIERIIEILDQAGNKSLVLIDEFGAGTDPDEASALGHSILEGLAAKNIPTIITTHLSKLKNHAYQNPRAMNASVEFDMETLQPTYRLFVGMPGNSKALEIAQRLGMSSSLLDRAREHLGEEEGKDWIDRLNEATMEAEKSRERARALEEEAQTIRDDAQKYREHLIQKKRIVEKEAEIELENLRRHLHVHIDKHLDQLQGAPSPFDERIEALTDHLETCLSHTDLDRRRRHYGQILKKGTEVFVISVNMPGKITRINKSKEQLKVKVGHMEVETDFKDISWIGDIKFLDEPVEVEEETAEVEESTMP